MKKIGRPRSNPGTNKVNISLTLDPIVLEKLREIATSKNKSFSSYADDVLAAHIREVGGNDDDDSSGEVGAAKKANLRLLSIPRKRRRA